MNLKQKCDDVMVFQDKNNTQYAVWYNKTLLNIPQFRCSDL